ncbi:hypothetical protein BGZ60DRAFT_205870 [Tricladium varicosporioides]|nr:hypothetical protein BGZ60DRAFT_205870 [Hymenoscyphus varicosporioides]
MLKELLQRTAPKPDLGHESSHPQEPSLTDILQRATDPYNLGSAEGGPKYRRRQAVPRRDIQFLLTRSAISNANKEITFTNDNMITAEDVFAETASRFHSDLSEVDKCGFLVVETPESLIEALTTHIDTLNTPHRSRLHDAISKVASFAGNFGPYFKIVEIIISSHPEYAAIAWGGVRLVLQLSSQYVEYFEKLAGGVKYKKMVHLDIGNGKMKNGILIMFPLQSRLPMFIRIY